MKTGKTIRGRYRIQRTLGKGSMGMTYKALDLKTKRFVAVKQLHLSRMQEWKSLEMFEREAKILQQLNHPRIPSYIDYFSLDIPSGKEFLLVQEYVEGQTLKQMIEKGWRGSETEILDIFLDLVDILVSLHSVRPPVIHRDINPKNIIISLNNHVYPPINDIYLVDFGAVQDRIRTTFLGGTTIVGTFGYIPFEQFSGQAVPASDYYALGATLLYMLTHRHPSEFPTDDLKPHFEPFLHGSPAMSRLLNGLLDPSAKKRIASPAQIREIFAESFVEPVEQFAGPLKQPTKTRIEKIVEAPRNFVFFRIPRQRIGFVISRTILHLTPKWLQLSEEMLGVGGGKSRRIPLSEIQPSNITWYFEKGKRSKGKSVLGINHAGETLEIGFHLSKAEIDWLTQEINEYIRAVKNQLPVTEKEEETFENIPEEVREPAEKPVQPAGTRIRKSVKRQDQLRFRIPETINKENITDMSVTFIFSLVFAGILTAMALYMMHAGSAGRIVGGGILLVSGIFWLFGLGLFLTGIFRLFGRTIIQLTPEWIHINRRCFGIGWAQHIPTAAIQQNDLIRYFHKNKQLLGINYAEKTSKIGIGLSREEIDWLIQEITGYIGRFAKAIPEGRLESASDIDLEMK